MDSVSPVFTENEIESEQIIALDQKQYFPLVTLPIVFDNGQPARSVRFRLNEAERQAIAAGADFVITELVFGDYAPIMLDVCPPDRPPAWFEPAPPQLKD